MRLTAHGTGHRQHQYLPADIEVDGEDEVDSALTRGEAAMVADSAREVREDVLQCPRCKKEYAMNKHNELLEHIDVCCDWRNLPFHLQNQSISRSGKLIDNTRGSMCIPKRGRGEDTGSHSVSLYWWASEPSLWTQPCPWYSAGIRGGGAHVSAHHQVGVGEEQKPRLVGQVIRKREREMMSCMLHGNQGFSQNLSSLSFGWVVSWK